jgi:PAS domain S-box-containing protein
MPSEPDSQRFGSSRQAAAGEEMHHKSPQSGRRPRIRRSAIVLLGIGGVLGFVPPRIPNWFVPCRIAAVSLITASLVIVVRQLGNIPKAATRLVVISACLAILTQTLSVCEVIHSLDGVPVLGKGGFLHDPIYSTAYPLAVVLLLAGFFFAALEAQTARHHLAEQGLRLSEELAERKRAEGALEKSEDKYRDLVENVNDVIYEVTSEGLVTYASPAIESLVGYSMSELIGQPFSGFIHGEDLARAAENFQEVLAGIVEPGEYRLVNKSGEIRWVLTSSKPILEGGKVVGVRGVLADITKRKLAEDAVRESEEKYRHLFEQLNDAALVADTETGIILDANEQAESLLGRTRDEIIGMHHSELHPPGESKYYRGMFAAHVLKGHATEFDGEVIRKDGSVVPAMISAATLTLGGKRLIVGLFRDITERKRAERMLQDSERRALALLNAPADRVALVDRDGVVLALNERMAESVGSSVDELVGVYGWDLVPSDVAALRKAQVDEVFRSGEPLHFEDQRAGIVYDNSLYPVLDPEGKVAAVAVFARDITDLKRAEDALRRSRDELEMQVEKRTAELRKANEELLAEIAERKRAEDALRESEERYRLLVDSAGYPITLIDRDGVILFFNPEGARNLGGTHSDFIGKSIYDIVPDMADALIERHQAMLRSGVGGVFEDEFELPSGKHWFVSNVQPVKDERGETYAILIISYDITDRKLAQEALKQSEARYRALIETSPDAITLADTEGKILLTNRRAALMHGFESVEDMLSDMGTVFDFMSKEDRQRAIEDGQRVLEKGSLRNLEYQALRKDGTYFPAEISASVITDEDGNPGTFLMVVRDVTERKQSAEALRQSEERYRTLVETSPDAISLVDLEANIVMANRQFALLLGYASVEEIISESRSAFDLVAPEDRLRVVGSFRTTLESGSMRNVGYEVVRKDGTRFDAEVSASVVSGVDGRPNGFMVVITDVTERKRAEGALRESQERYRLLVDSAEYPITLLDRDGVILLVNPAGARNLGGSPEDLVGKSVYEFLPGMTDALIERHTRVIDSGKGASFEEEIDLASGKRWFLSNLQPIRDARGEPYAVQIISHDTTERKRAEEQIKAALEEKEMLLKEIQHRVKNNLQVISSLFDLQSRYTDDDQMLDMLKESRNRLRSIALIHEKLYQAQDLTRIDFAEYVRSLAVHLFRSYGVGSDAIELKTSFDTLTLSVDAAIPCALIVNELVSNCLKHAFPAGRRGEVRIELRSDDGQCTVIVGDDGVGLAEDFDFEEPQSLGLRLVKTLTDQLKGTIHLDRNEGTTFRIRFRVSQ